MSKLIRNTSDQEGREFWESVEKAAAEIEGAPRWMKAGISVALGVAAVTRMLWTRKVTRAVGVSTACISLLTGFVACGGERPNVVAAPRNNSPLAPGAGALIELDSGAIITDAGAREPEAQRKDAAVLTDANVQLSRLDAGPEGPVAIATRFMDAIRRKRQETLLSLTALPFQLRDSGAAVSCKDGGSAAQGEELAKLLSCVLTDDLLAEELQANPQPETTVLRTRDIPAWARRFRKGLTPRRTPVMIYVPRNGVTFYFVVVVEDSAVRELWKHAEFDSN